MSLVKKPGIFNSVVELPDLYKQKHGEKPTGYELHAKVHIVSVRFPTPLKGFLK